MADEASVQAVARENEDEDSGLSMLDVLEGENQLEEDAVAVLGDSDDKNCTYLMVTSNYGSLIGLRRLRSSIACRLGPGPGPGRVLFFSGYANC